ncbi:hypothetical protein OJ998_30350 [Solirubrobacter taibaiensis]|nr:hypothetical protein [Solirubrobacter taibaiensis]
MTPDLEQALRELDVDWPATPDLAATMAARVAAEPRDRRARAWSPRVAGRARRRVAAIAAATLVALVGGVLAVPDARTTVFRWFGIESVEIKRGEPSATPGASLDLGIPTTIERLRAPVLRARDLGTPGVYETAMPDGTRAASLVYDGPILVQTFRAQASPFIEKTIGTGSTVERLKVDGATAFWIGGSHGFAYQSPTGFGFEQPRIAGNTLLVERRDGLLLRIEGVRSRDRAVAIARSVQ